MSEKELARAAASLSAYALVKDRLAEVERSISSSLESDIPLVRRIAGYLHRTGGKRLRPALVLLCAQACGYRGEDDVELGTIVEFIHTASLLHDDIIDEASVRRGRTAANRIWGNEVAVLLGDYIYIRSISISVSLGRLRLVELLAKAATRLIEGEILDVAYNGDSSLSEDRYLDVIARKTASLFEVCGRSAAALADVPETVEEALGEYGRNLGMAFQLIDDRLDYCADPEDLGKHVGADLREAKVTFPLIHLLRHSDGEVRELVRRSLDDPEVARREFPRVVRAMEEQGSLDATREVAAGYAEQAREALAGVAPSAARDALGELPDFVLARRH